jgi:tight adherence protein B
LILLAAPAAAAAPKSGTFLTVVILGLVFMAIVLGGQSIYWYFRGQRDNEELRVRRRLGLDSAQQQEEEALSSLLREQAADSMLESLGKMGEEMAQTLKGADDARTVSQLVVTMIGLGGIVTMLLIPFFGLKALILGVPLAYVPYALVKRKAASRSVALLLQLPDALDLMGRAMQAGTGLSETFKLVSEETKDPLGVEFGQVYDELRFGRDWRIALEDLVNRFPEVFELRLFVSSMLLQRETGGNMIETVGRLSKLIRTRHGFDAKVKAMTSEARASGLVLAGMPVGVLGLVMLANFEYLTPMWRTGAGQTAMVYCAGSYGMGIFLMRTMSRVDV